MVDERLVRELRFARLDEARKLRELARNALRLGRLVDESLKREVDRAELRDLGRHRQVAPRRNELDGLGAHRLLERLGLVLRLRVIRRHRHLDERRRRHLVLGTKRTERGNRLTLGVDELVDVVRKAPRRLLRIGVAGRILLTHDRLAVLEIAELMRDFLGDERHVRMKEPKRLVEDVLQDRKRDRLVRRVLHILDVPVADLRPEEVVDRKRAVLDAIALEDLGESPARLVARDQHMAVIGRQFLRRQRFDIWNLRSAICQIHLNEFGGVPNLGREVAADLELLLVDLRVALKRGDERDGEAERVRRIGLDELERIERVALRLGHLRAVRRTDNAVDHDVLERRLLHEVNARHHHARDPEEDDVLRRHEIASRIVVVEVLRLLRPTERLERPQPAREPSVQHVLVLLQIRQRQLVVPRRLLRGRQRLLGGLLNKDKIFLAFTYYLCLIAYYLIPADVVSRNAMPPPELTGNAPILDVLHPVEVDLRPAVRDELHLAGLDRGDRGLGERLHLDEPLLGETRLDDLVAAVAVPDLVVEVFDVVEEPARLEVLDDDLAALPAVHAAVFRAGELVHVSVVGHDVDLLEVVALADEEVVRIVRRRDLHDARTELAVNVVVADHGDLAARQRQDHGLADKVRIALVLRIHRNGRIARQRLRTRRRDHHVVLVRLARRTFRAPDDRILDVPEVTVVRLVLDLVVRERRAAARTPVDDVVALVDEALVKELLEDLQHRAVAAVVEREALALPVRRVAEHALLVDDRAAVLALPLPDALEELLAPEVLTALALLLERLLDDILRGDAGVVCAGEPEGVAALHAAPADEDVLNRLVERVAHVQNARHVRRRNNDGIRHPPVGVVMKIPVLLPQGIPLGLRGLRVVMLFHHSDHLSALNL